MDVGPRLFEGPGRQRLDPPAELGDPLPQLSRGRVVAAGQARRRDRHEPPTRHDHVERPADVLGILPLLERRIHDDPVVGRRRLEREEVAADHVEAVGLQDLAQADLPLDHIELGVGETPADDFGDRSRAGRRLEDALPPARRDDFSLGDDALGELARSGEEAGDVGEPKLALADGGRILATLLHLPATAAQVLAQRRL
ncbi:MAG TPA: hypothetical protein VK034_10285 [Enhygromyxa sp.]|nr:hypothetical protein [Enhygromyxa sp.]